MLSDIKTNYFYIVHIQLLWLYISSDFYVVQHVMKPGSFSAKSNTPCFILDYFLCIGKLCERTRDVQSSRLYSISQVKISAPVKK